MGEARPGAFERSLLPAAARAGRLAGAGITAATAHVGTSCPKVSVVKVPGQEFNVLFQIIA